MLKKTLLSFACVVALPGCASIHNPYARADLFESLDQGAEAIEASKPAFERLQQLQKKWERRGRVSDGAKAIAGDVGRITAAQDAVLSQAELSGVMLSAIKDLEAECDAMLDTLAQSDAPASQVAVAAGQKYLAQRMVSSIVTMTKADMTNAVEAADVFGRDVAQFQRMLDASINGDEELGIQPADNPEVQDSLSQIEELFTGYIAESSDGVLENVVSQYDAWLALQDLRALAAKKSGRGASAPAAAAPAGKAADAAEAADEGGDEGGSAADEGGGDDAGAADDGAGAQGSNAQGAGDDTGGASGSDEPGADDGSVDEGSAADDASDEDDGGGAFTP